jgi:hypothetical protein
LYGLIGGGAGFGSGLISPVSGSRRITCADVRGTGVARATASEYAAVATVVGCSVPNSSERRFGDSERVGARTVSGERCVDGSIVSKSSSSSSVA